MLGQRSNRTTARGFTLVEILVVLAIISILITISVVVAGRVTQGGRVSATQDLIKVLDSTLTSYISEREAKVPAVYRDDADNLFPLWDGRPVVNGAVDRDTVPALPSQALYLLIASEVPAIQKTLEGIDSKYIRKETNIVNIEGQTLRKRPATGEPLQNGVSFSILDAWGRPIRFVHPAFDGGGGDYYSDGSLRARDPIGYDVDANGTVAGVRELLRRSYRPFDPSSSPAANPVGDADEGLCVSGRPYFYSAGPDGDPGTRQDNVYTMRPTFPPETEKLD